jgi:hypothetical protein
MTTKSNNAKHPKEEPGGVAPKPECFVIMPISDPEGYAAGHFRRVFEDIFIPACEMAGYRATRADDTEAANVIHLDILQRLLDSPLALCDLSSRNPNVMFELGLRQAFDKPVVLVQEVGTPRIFDVSLLRTTDYRRERIYHHVLEDQQSIAAAIKATISASEKKEGMNSLVRLLSLPKPASLLELPEADKDPALRVVRAELSSLRSEIRGLLEKTRPDVTTPEKINYNHNINVKTEKLINEIEGAIELLGLESLEDSQLIHWKRMLDDYLASAASAKRVYLPLMNRAKSLREQISVRLVDDIPF